MKSEEIKLDGYYQVYRYDKYAMPVVDRVYHVVWMDNNTKMLWYHEYDMKGLLLKNGNTQYDDMKHFAAKVYNRVKPPKKIRRKRRTIYGKGLLLK